MIELDDEQAEARAWFESLRDRIRATERLLDESERMLLRHRTECAEADEAAEGDR